MPLSIRIPNPPQRAGPFDIELSLDTLAQTEVRIRLKDEYGDLRFRVNGVDALEHSTQVVGTGSMGVESWIDRGQPSIVVVGNDGITDTEEEVYVLP
jgi:hypothetical protein